jgi:hypothetical protein
MIDFRQAVAEAVGDPLVLVLGLFLLGGLASYLLFRSHPTGEQGSGLSS